MCRLTCWGGGYLGLSPNCLKGLFHFTVYFAHTSSLKHTPVLFFPCHPHPSHPSCDILSQTQIPVPLSLCPSIRPSILLSFLSSAFLCSVVTLSSLPHVLLQAYSVLDAKFYCHSVYTGTLWVRASVTTSTMQASVIFVSDSNLVTSCREFQRHFFSLRADAINNFLVCVCIYSRHISSSSLY